VRPEDHRDSALDMVGTDDREGAAGVGPAEPPTILRARDLVRGVIGVGKLVVLGFGDPSEGDAQPAPQPDPLTFVAAAEVT
jgi:hypothetical protein